MIQVENLTKRYGATTAIEDISFSVARGGVVGFLGPNGAGKTTTMRILTGSLGASEGRALIDGKSAFDHPREVKRLVGYLPENPPLYTEMTVRDYVAFAGRLKGVSDPKAAAENAIGKVGLEGVAHRIIDHLSKGYRQRVGLAQALVHDPKVLILDEPTSGLDPAQRVEIRELLKELAEGERTIVLSTHVLAEVEAIAREVVIINKGRLVVAGDIQELSAGRGRIHLEVQRPGDEAAAALRGVEGVTEVAVEPGGRYSLSLAPGDADARPAVAAAAVPFGLLSLGASETLEDVYLSLTRGTP